jgi:hypothetical protein
MLLRALQDRSKKDNSSGALRILSCKQNEGEKKKKKKKNFSKRNQNGVEAGQRDQYIVVELQCFHGEWLDGLVGHAGLFAARRLIQQV